MLAARLPRLCGAVGCRALRAPGGLLALLPRGGGGAGRHQLRLPQVLHQPARHTNTGVEAGRSIVAELPSLPELAADVQEVETAASAAICARSRVLIAVDPDNAGAVAVAQLAADGGPMLRLLQRTDVTLHDMPCLRVAVGKRQRRQADPAAVVAIVRQSLQHFAAAPADVACTLEEPVPNPANGRHSLFGTGYAYGVWNGVLSASGVAVDTVSARRWKSDLGLNKCGKDGSRALALALFPRAEPMLRRKKDHGRAEALLILAWALGMRLAKTSGTAALLLASSGPAAPLDSPLEPASSCEEDLLEPEAEAEPEGEAGEGLPALTAGNVLAGRRLLGSTPDAQREAAVVAA